MKPEDMPIEQLRAIVAEFRKVHCPKLTAGKKALMEFALKHKLFNMPEVKAELKAEEPKKEEPKKEEPKNEIVEAPKKE
jgi:hypothetical protein